MKDLQKHDHHGHEGGCCCGHHKDEHEHREACCGGKELVKEPVSSSESHGEECFDSDGDSGSDDEEGEQQHSHEHEACGCGHDHENSHEHEACGCGHDHENFHEHEACGCGHDHENSHEHEACGCGHDHENSHEHEACSCGHDHENSHEHEACSCGHDHENSHEHEGCSCGHDHDHSHGHEGCSCCSHGDGCDCGHDHGTIDQSSLKRIALSTAFLIAMYLVPLPMLKFALAAVAVLICGYDMFWQGLKSMAKLSFNEKALLTIAVVAAFVIGEYAEAAIVTMLFKLGEFFEAKAITKSRGEIASLTKIRSDKANVILLSGTVESTDARYIPVGTKILVKVGEKIPLDCTVLEGESYIDNSALTGESVAVGVEQGSKLLSGAVNMGGVIICETTSLFEDSAASKIIQLVEQAAANKGATESFITKFAKIYTPVVIVLAVMLAFIPPFFSDQGLSTWVYRALVFLVTSCPCAFVISVPLSFYSGIGACSREGILVKGSKYIEKLAEADCVVMDKTGTVTSGKLRVSSIDLYTERDIGDCLAIAESFSNHPTARAISAFYRQREIDTTRASEVSEIPGKGLQLLIDGVPYYCGSYRLMEDKGISIYGAEGANVYFANDKELLAAVKMSDTPREEAYDAIKGLRAEGIENITILTGDGAAAAEFVRSEIGADTVECNLLPEDKVFFMSEIKAKRKSTIYIGDGINDAPVIALSDCGIAMGMGSEAAINTADAVLVKDNLMGIITAIRISKATMRIAKQNIIFALGVKVLILILGALGYVPMWAAVIADVGVMIVAVLNSTRMLVKKKQEQNPVLTAAPAEFIPEVE